MIASVNIREIEAIVFPNIHIVATVIQINPGRKGAKHVYVTG